MKKLICIFSLFICLLGIPFVTLAKDVQPTILINNLTYKPQYDPLIISNILYISGDDLAAMTYGSYTQTSDTATLIIQNQTLTYSFQSQTCTLNIKKYIPQPNLHITNDHIVYMPITFLDDINYAYSYEDYALKISPLMPFSMATDQAKDHKLVPTDYESFDEVLSRLLTSNESDALILETKKNRQYISLISLNYKATCYKIMKNLIQDAPATTVYLRHLDVSGKEPVLAHFDTYPLSCRIDGEILSVKFAESTLTCNCFWAAYYPYNMTTEIDVNKSLDIMLMRTIYEYYRDTYHIKDNLNLSPIIKVTASRSDYMSYEIYFDEDTSHKTYELMIYKQSCGNAYNYYVDLINHA